MMINQKRHVQRAETLKLIRLYRNNHCLWNPRSSNYMNALLKERTWQFIANIFNQSLTVDQIKRRVASLRYFFTLELLVMKRREMEGYNYVPRFEYFKEMEFLKDAIMLSFNVIAAECQAQDLINSIVKDSFVLSCSVEHVIDSFESNEDSIRNAWRQSLKSSDQFGAAPIYNRIPSGEDDWNIAAKTINSEPERDYYIQGASTPLNGSDSDYTTCNEVLTSLEGGATWDPSESQFTYTESEAAKQCTPIKKVLTGKYVIKPKAQANDFDHSQRHENIRTVDPNMRIDSGTNGADPVRSEEKLNDGYENSVENDYVPSCSRCPYAQKEPGQNEPIYENKNRANRPDYAPTDALQRPWPIRYSPARQPYRRYENATTNNCEQIACRGRPSRRGNYEDAIYQSHKSTAKQRSSGYAYHSWPYRKNSQLIRNPQMSPDNGRKLRREANNAQSAPLTQRTSLRSGERSLKQICCTNNRERLNDPHVDNLMLCPKRMRDEYDDGNMESQAHSIQASDNDKSSNCEVPQYQYNDNKEYSNGQTGRLDQSDEYDEYIWDCYDDSKDTELDDMQTVRNEPNRRSTPQDCEEEFAQRRISTPDRSRRASPHRGGGFASPHGRNGCASPHDRSGRASPHRGSGFASPHDRSGRASPRMNVNKPCMCSNGGYQSSNNRDDFAQNYRRSRDMPDKNLTRRYEDDYNRPNDRFRDDEYNRGNGVRDNSYAMNTNTSEYPRQRQDECGEESDEYYEWCMQKCRDQKRNSANYRKPNNKYVPDYDQQVRSTEYSDDPLGARPRQQGNRKRNSGNQFTQQQHGNAGRYSGQNRDCTTERYQYYDPSEYQSDEGHDSCNSCVSNSRNKRRSHQNDYHSSDDCRSDQRKQMNDGPTQKSPAMYDNSEISQNSKTESAGNQADNLSNKLNNTEEMMRDCECITDVDEVARENEKDLPRPNISRCEVAVETDIDMNLRERNTPPQNVDCKDSNTNHKTDIIEDDKNKSVDGKDQPPVRRGPSTGSVRKPFHCKPPLPKNRGKSPTNPGVKSDKLKQRMAEAADKCRSHFYRHHKFEDDPAARKFQARSIGKVADSPCNEMKNMGRGRSNVESRQVLTFEVPPNYAERAINIMNNHVINDLKSESSGVCVVSTKISRNFGNRRTSNPFIKIACDPPNNEIIVLHPPPSELPSVSKNSISMQDVNPAKSQAHSLAPGHSEKSIGPSAAKPK